MTPEQTQQIEAARQATISACEQALGRPLTDFEKTCIHDDIKDGQLVGYVESPLSDTLNEKQAEYLKQHPSTAPDMSGMSRYPYLATDGGPDILLPAEIASSWSRITSMAAVTDPHSDYGRACAATLHAPMATISVGTGAAMVLAGPPICAWGRSADHLVEIYDLQSMSTMKLDDLLDRATAALPTSQLKDSGNTLLLKQPDAFLLYAGDTPTDAGNAVYRIPLPPGKYHILTGTYSAAGSSVTICRLKPE